MITKYELGKMIDHTNLHAFATHEDMKKLCDEAIQYGFAMVAVNSGQTKRCAEFLKDSEVHVGAAIGFPLGQQTIEVKVYEAKNAIANGADEIDYVINITEVKEKNYQHIQREMEEMVSLCREKNVISKVIFENCYLEKDEIVMLAKIAKIVEPDYIKTSTGFGTGGATKEDVEVMKEHVGDVVNIKAAGGIRTIADAFAFIEMGVKRIGTSSGTKILNDYDQYVK